MKKLLALVLISFVSFIVSFNCMADDTRERSISIHNKTDNKVKVRDKDNHETSVDGNSHGSLSITVREPHGSLFPSALLPKVTTITVTGDNDSNTINVDENTNSITINSDFDLSKD